MHYLYRHFNKHGKLLYVGVSYDWHGRTDQHKQFARWWSEVTRVEIERYPDASTAHAAEIIAIQKEGPICNIVYSTILLDGIQRKKLLQEFDASKLSIFKFAKLHDIHKNIMSAILALALYENNTRVRNKIHITRKMKIIPNEEIGARLSIISQPRKIK